MLLIQRVSEDCTKALKAGDAEKAAALRFVLSSLQARQKELWGQGVKENLKDEEAVKVLRRETKKRKEAIKLYEKGGRADLSQKEQRELELLQAYVPQAMSAEEVGTVVEEVVKGGARDFPVAMKEAMARVKGRADGKTVSELVRQKLSSLAGQ